MSALLTDFEVSVLANLAWWDPGLARRYREHLTTGSPLDPDDAAKVARLAPLARW